MSIQQQRIEQWLLYLCHSSKNNFKYYTITLLFFIINKIKCHKSNVLQLNLYRNKTAYHQPVGTKKWVSNFFVINSDIKAFNKQQHFNSLKALMISINNVFQNSDWIQTEIYRPSLIIVNLLVHLNDTDIVILYDYDQTIFHNNKILVDWNMFFNMILIDKIRVTEFINCL